MAEFNAISDLFYLTEHVGNLTPGDIYLIGVARAKSKCHLAKLISLVISCKEHQLEEMRVYLWEGDIESAQHLISEEGAETMP
jgi:hypothetical protein